MKKLLILYTEIAGYLLKCVETLASAHSVEVHIIRYPVDPNAPFDFQPEGAVTLYDKSSYTSETILAFASE
ncbi:MAG: hypothetical protein IH946_10860, partial [Bacteroidetes bacterium]|nr:hypothetical protein [Bacteroidota bacterium]